MMIFDNQNFLIDFAAYLTQNSQENLLSFYFAIDEYRCLTSESERGDIGTKIYNTYLLTSGSFRRLKQFIEFDKLSNKTPDCFDMVQKEVSVMLQRLGTNFNKKRMKMARSLTVPPTGKKVDTISEELQKQINSYFERNKPVDDGKGDKKSTPTSKPMASLTLSTSNENTDVSPVMRRLDKKRGSKPNPFETKVKLDDVLFVEEFPLVRNLISISMKENDYEACVSPIVDIFIKRRKIFDLIKHLVEYEIEHFEGATSLELFKRPSLSSVLILQFFKRVAKTLLSDMIAPVISSLSRFPNGLTVESSRFKQLDAKQISNNIENLSLLFDSLIVEMIKCRSSFPPILLKGLLVIYNTVESKLAGQGINAIGSLFIYQFFCNALVKPESILKTDCPKVTRPGRKILAQFCKVLRVLVTKTILPGLGLTQSIATDIRQQKITSFVESLIVKEKIEVISSLSTSSLRIAEKRFLEYVIDHLPQLWTKVVYDPQLAALMLPCVTMGLDALTETFQKPL